jgi:DNA-binding MarR family transcriptional regulator
MSPTAERYRLLIADVYELAGASRRTSEAIAREHGQSVARWHVMSVLDGAEHPVAHIARRLGLTRQSVGRVVDDLVTDGQVQKRANPLDLRAPLASLTDRGRETLRLIVADSDAMRVRQLERSGLRSSDLDDARVTIRQLVAMLST